MAERVLRAAASAVEPRTRADACVPRAVPALPRRAPRATPDAVLLGVLALLVGLAVVMTVVASRAAYDGSRSARAVRSAPSDDVARERRAERLRIRGYRDGVTAELARAVTATQYAAAAARRDDERSAGLLLTDALRRIGRARDAAATGAPEGLARVQTRLISVADAYGDAERTVLDGLASGDDPRWRDVARDVAEGNRSLRSAERDARARYAELDGDARAVASFDRQLGRAAGDVARVDAFR